MYPNEALARLQVLMADAAHDLGVPPPFNKLTLGKLRGPNLQPLLKFKAAKTRAMVPLVLRLLDMHFPATNDRELRRYMCLNFLNLAYLELGDWKAGSAKSLEQYCRRHVLLYLSLSREAVRTEENWVSWRWYPKHHMLLHLSCEQAQQWGNPRFWWCYSDEGAIGIAVKLAESAHPRTLAATCFEKYITTLSLEYND